MVLTCNQRHCYSLDYGWLSSRESFASTITALCNLIHQMNIVYALIKYKYDMTVKFYEFFLIFFNFHFFLSSSAVFSQLLLLTSEYENSFRQLSAMQ